MNKKLSLIISILFLSSLLIISCNNNGKTGPTSKGLGHYAGTWELTSDSSGILVLTISSDGKAILEKEQNISIVKITDKGNEVYEFLLEYKNEQQQQVPLVLTFTSDNSGTFTQTLGGTTIKGTAKKIK